MESNKGITLISLIIYVTVMLIAVSIVGSITSFYYANINNEYIENRDEYKEANLDLYLINDLKNEEILILDNNGKKISSGARLNCIKLVFINDETTSVTYTIKTNKLYRDSIKIYETSSNIHFEITDVSPTTGSLIEEKCEIKIVNAENQILKKYTVNVKPKVNYPTPT